jgi:hypothetical protein
MKVCPVGAKLFHKDIQTGMTKLIAAFRDFVKGPKTKGLYELITITLLQMLQI